MQPNMDRRVAEQRQAVFGCDGHHTLVRQISNGKSNCNCLGSFESNFLQSMAFQLLHYTPYFYERPLRRRNSFRNVNQWVSLMGRVRQLVFIIRVTPFLHDFLKSQLIRDKNADKCKKFRLWNQEIIGNVVHMSESLVVKLYLLILTPEGKEATRGRDTNKKPDRRSNYTYPGSLTFRTL
jgi:hypothetical protein